jgi:hypothetical protein
VSEPTTKIVELEAERDELRRQLADARRAIAEVEAHALEQAALHFLHHVWVADELKRLARNKRRTA